MERIFSRQVIFGSWRRSVFTLAAVLLCGVPNAIFAATFTASLDNGAIVLGESATLSLEVEGGSADQEPSPPRVDGLRMDGRGSSQQVTFINGSTTSKTTYTYTITPQRAGEFEIPAITATVNGRKISTQPLKLMVAKVNAPSAETINSGSELAFMKLMLPRTNVYAGEIFTAELEIYVRDSVQNFGNFQLTAMPADGFTMGKNTQGQRRREQVGNSIYNVFPIQIVLTAVRSGDFTIGPITANLVVQLPVGNGNNRRNDPFGDDPFGMFRRVENRPLSLATEAKSIQTRALPMENAPRYFNGAVGDYIMTVNAGPTNVTAGDPITIRVQISGRGSLDTISLPPQNEPAWDNFKTYPPTSKIETSDTLGIQGIKTFEEIVVPQNSDVHELPPISFSFFDPEKKAYQTLTQPPLQLTVKPGGTTIAPTVAMNHSSDNSPPASHDIVPIKQRLGSSGMGTVLIETNWFLAAQSLPVLAWMSLLVWRKRKENLANNPRLRRQREVARILHEGLAKLRTLAQENKSDEFFATLFRLLQERLGERLDLPASAITEDVIEERLRRSDAKASTLQSLEELFQLCNLARYAPIRSSQELAAVIPKLEMVLNDLQEVKA